MCRLVLRALCKDPEPFGWAVVAHQYEFEEGALVHLDKLAVKGLRILIRPHRLLIPPCAHLLCPRVEGECTGFWVWHIGGFSDL